LSNRLRYVARTTRLQNAQPGDHRTVQPQCRHIYCTTAGHLSISCNPYLFKLLYCTYL